MWAFLREFFDYLCFLLFSVHWYLSSINFAETHSRHSVGDAECSNKTIGTVSRTPWQWSSMWCIFSLSLLTYKLNWLHTIRWAWMWSTNCWACVIVSGLCLFILAWLGFSSLNIYPTWVGPYKWRKVAKSLTLKVELENRKKMKRDWVA